ncbi:unnamed protein product [Linum trigynum]|uniref:Uncharacterized protein n=1 Tax=Linum trigynum TaxID=586398 RepID=A0AAV2DAC1_9ROSI
MVGKGKEDGKAKGKMGQSAIQEYGGRGVVGGGVVIKERLGKSKKANGEEKEQEVLGQGAAGEGGDNDGPNVEESKAGAEIHTPNQGAASERKVAFQMKAPDPEDDPDKKRTTGMVADLAEDPTPVKKLCLEDVPDSEIEDKNATVEEASREWP